MKPTKLDLSEATAIINPAGVKPSTAESDSTPTSGSAKPPKVSTRDSVPAISQASSPSSPRGSATAHSKPTLSPRSPTTPSRGASQRQIDISPDQNSLSTLTSPRSLSQSTAAPTLSTARVTTSTTTSDVMMNTQDVMAASTKHLAPADLAKRLIQAESENGTLKLEGSKVRAMLRQGAKLDGVNVIEQELKPFMKRHFENLARPLHKKFDEVTQSYTKVQPEIENAYFTLGAKDFAQDPKVCALMEPVIAPILDFIFGEDRMLISSGWPNAIIELFWAVDDEVVTWFNSNGSGNLADLQLARQNALITFFGTRSFMADWTTALSSDNSKPASFYRPLLGFANSTMNLKLTAFAQQIMDCGPKKRMLLFKQRAIISGRPAQPERRREDSSFTSPRSSRVTSPRSAIASSATMKENAHRRAAQEQTRRKEVDTYSTQINLPLINRDFFMKFKEDVLGLELDTYREAKANWDGFCLQSLSLFIEEKEEAGEKIAQSLLALRDSLQEKIRRASDS